MKTITVIYWHSPSLEKDVGIQNKTEYEYSIEKRNEIIDRILNVGLNVMILQNKEYMTIAIDNGRFMQR